MVRFWIAAVVAGILILAACEDSRSKPEGTTAAGQQKPAVAAPVATPATPAKPCEQRFILIGMALTRAALDTKTGQQCRTAENAPRAFRSLPMCFDLFSQGGIPPPPPAPPATPATPGKPCGQRFIPIGMALTRAALDTKAGQQCRTAENAPPAFHALPMCADLLRRFPD
jgi:hypothetical protein